MRERRGARRRAWAAAGIVVVLLLGGLLGTLGPQAPPVETAGREGPGPEDSSSTLREGAPPVLEGPRGAEPPPPPRPRWRLRVLDPEGRPVRGAGVHALPPAATWVRGEGRWRGTTEDAGTVEVPVDEIAPGEVLVVQAPGFLPATVRPPPADSPPVDEEVVLPRGASIAGMVVDPAGEPVAGVEVRARPGSGALPANLAGYLPGPDAAGQVATARTDAEGRFRLEGIGRFPVMVTAHRPGWVNLLGPDSHVRGSREDLRLALHPQARAGVRAIDAVSRLPIPRFSAGPNDAMDPPLRVTTLASPLGDEPRTGWARDRGEWWLTFTVTEYPNGVRPERVSVQVSAAGYRRSGVEVPLRFLGEGGPREVHDVPLEPLPSRDAVGRVEFRVSYPALGRAPDLARVLLHASVLDLPPGPGDPRYLPYEALELALEEGRAVAELPAGAYRMALGGPFPCPWPPDWIEVVVPPGGVVPLDLAFRGCLVRVRAMGPERLPIPFFSVQAFQGSRGEFRTHAWLLEDELLADEARHFGVSPGEIVLRADAGKPLRLSVVADGFDPWFRTLEAAPEGQTLDVEAILQPARSPSR